MALYRRPLIRFSDDQLIRDSTQAQAIIVDLEKQLATQQRIRKRIRLELRERRLEAQKRLLPDATPDPESFLPKVSWNDLCETAANTNFADLSDDAIKAMK